MKKTFLLITALALAAMPLFAGAASQQPNSNIWNPNILKGPLTVCVGSDALNQSNSNFVGPKLPVCESLCDFVSQILNIVYFVIAFVIWIIVPIDVAIGGIMYMLAGANPGMVAKAKTILLGAVWAIAITLCSFIIIKTFVTVMGIAGVGGFGAETCKLTQ